MRIWLLVGLSLLLFVACTDMPVETSPTSVAIDVPTEVAVVETAIPLTTIPIIASELTAVESTPNNAATEQQHAIAQQIKRNFPSVNFAKTPIDEPFAMSRWAESSPEAQGLDSTTLDEMAAYIPQELDLVHSVVVARNNTLVYEYYKEGRDENMGDFVWSVTKSFTAVLVGIAVDEGLLNLDQSLENVLTPEQLAGAVSDLGGIAVRDLLTMTSGITCPNDGCHNDSLSKVLKDALDYESGSAFTYDTSSTHLLSAVIENTTGQPLNQYAAEKLFTPLGIAPPPWQIDGEDRAYGGKGLAMRPRDMAKFGQLILQEGVWEGEQIVSADFIQAATQNQLGDIDGAEYGYLFWLSEVDGYEMITAVGFGGQYIGIVPDLDLVFAITSAFYPRQGNSGAIIEPFILGAIETP